MPRYRRIGRSDRRRTMTSYSTRWTTTSTGVMPIPSSEARTLTGTARLSPPVQLARALPLNVAMRVALMGKHERMTAGRAFQLGLVSEVVPHAQLMERAREVAAVVNSNAPLAVRGTRLGIRKGLSLPLYEAEL